jgi:hypothetical protein
MRLQLKLGWGLLAGTSLRFSTAINLPTNPAVEDHLRNGSPWSEKRGPLQRR